MLRSRRHLLWATGMSLPVLICGPVAYGATSSISLATGALPTDRDKAGDVVTRGGREACPFCTPSQNCPQHLS